MILIMGVRRSTGTILSIVLGKEKKKSNRGFKNFMVGLRSNILLRLDVPYWYYR